MATNTVPDAINKDLAATVSQTDPAIAKAAATPSASTTTNAFNTVNEGGTSTSVGSSPSMAEGSPSVTTMKAATNTVDPTTGTVQGQLKGLLDSNSPYIQQARMQSDQAANARGLVNSSMARQAGEAAAIGAALPIAQSDATIYTNQSLTNQANLNAVNQFNAAAQNTASNAGFNAQNQQILQQMNSQTQQLIATNETAARTYQAGQAAISQILTDPNLSPDQKNVMINSQVQLMNGGLAVIDATNRGTLNTNLRNLLSFDTSQILGGMSASVQNQMYGYMWSRPSSGGGGGSMICTRLNDLGLLDNTLFEADCKFGRIFMLADPEAFAGYQIIAPHFIKRMKSRGQAFTWLVRLVAMPVIKEMACQAGHGNGSFVGRIELALFTEIARLAFKCKRVELPC